MYYEIQNFQRNHECSNVRFLKLEGGDNPPSNFKACEEHRLADSGASLLYVQGNVRYYGYL